jgi:hypothetical protein
MRYCRHLRVVTTNAYDIISLNLQSCQVFKFLRARTTGVFEPSPCYHFRKNTPSGHGRQRGRRLARRRQRLVLPGVVAVRNSIVWSVVSRRWGEGSICGTRGKPRSAPKSTPTRQITIPSDGGKPATALRRHPSQFMYEGAGEAGAPLGSPWCLICLCTRALARLVVALTSDGFIWWSTGEALKFGIWLLGNLLVNVTCFSCKVSVLKLSRTSEITYSAYWKCNNWMLINILVFYIY